jgi:nucleoid DNA-binding protein
MNKGEIAGRLARQTHRSKAAAADDVDRVVHNILSSLRRGEKARLPGLGTFVPGAQPAFEFESDGSARERAK